MKHPAKGKRALFLKFSIGSEGFPLKYYKIVQTGTKTREATLPGFSANWLS